MSINPVVQKVPTVRNSVMRQKIPIVRREIEKVKERLAEIAKLSQKFDEWIENSRSFVEEHRSPPPPDYDQSVSELFSSSSSEEEAFETRISLESSSNEPTEATDSEVDAEWEARAYEPKKHSSEKPKQRVPQISVHVKQTIPPQNHVFLGSVMGLSATGHQFTSGAPIRTLFERRPDILDAFFYPEKHPENYLVLNVDGQQMPLTRQVMNECERKYGVQFVDGSLQTETPKVAQPPAVRENEKRSDEGKVKSVSESRPVIEKEKSLEELASTGENSTAVVESPPVTEELRIGDEWMMSDIGDSVPEMGGTEEEELGLIVSSIIAVEQPQPKGPVYLDWEGEVVASEFPPAPESDCATPEAIDEWLFKIWKFPGPVLVKST